MFPIVRIEVASGQVTWRNWRTAGGAWVGVCDDLGLTMEGETFAALQESISETLQLLFTDLLEEQELQRFLTERGWRAFNIPPVREQGDRVTFDIPWQNTVVQHAAA